MLHSSIVHRVTWYSILENMYFWREWRFSQRASLYIAIISINVYQCCSIAVREWIHQSTRRNKLKFAGDFILHSLNRVLSPARYRSPCNWHIIKVPLLIVTAGDHYFKPWTLSNCNNYTTIIDFVSRRLHSLLPLITA